MKKIYVVYLKNGTWRKAVLDEVLHKQLTLDPIIEQITEYENEMLMEKRYAEKLGVSDSRKILFG